MAVYVSNLTVNTGTTFSQIFTLENAETNSPTNLTGFTIASSSATGGQSIEGGFKDPNAKYPTELYIKKPDTNLLAQESVDTHASKDLKHTLTADWTTSTGTAKHPASTQSSAKYPTKRQNFCTEKNILNCDNIAIAVM